MVSIATILAMSLTRTFLGWDRPFLDLLAERLIDRVQDNPVADLSAITVVLPTSRSGRRLSEILAQKLERALLLPRIITVGELPEVLYPAVGRIATELESELAWARALKRIGPDELSLLLPSGLEENDLSTLLGWARELHALYKELSAAALSFEELLERGETLALFDDSERWEVVATLRDLYLEELDSHTLVCKHQQRMLALEEEAQPDLGEIILASLPDLNEISTRLLALNSGQIGVMIHAPEDLAESFDRFGRIITSKWLTRQIRLDDKVLSVEYSYPDESDRLCERLSRVAEAYAVDEITIGIGDKAIVPYLAERFIEKGVPFRHAAGKALPCSSPVLLLKGISAYLASGAARDFASLVRHPDLHHYLQKKLSGSESKLSSILSSLDRYHTGHLPQQLSATSVRGNADISAVLTQVDKLIQPLQSREVEPISKWCSAIAVVLKEIYTVSYESEDSSEIKPALGKIVEILDEVTQVVGENLDAATALRVLAHRIASETVSPTGTERAIELLEWLEIQLDDAPLLALTGMNDGKVPGVLAADPFLPNALRQGLGLLDNDRRYARDAFMLEAIINSRKVISITAASCSPNGDPFIPSRLLLARPAKELPTLVPKLFGHPPRLVRSMAPSSTNWRIPIKPTLTSYPITALPVTSFRDYIRCPYRYYLKHVLKLRSLNDQAMELDPLGYGSFAHDILSKLNAETSQTFRSADKIYGFLSGELERLFTRRFGKGVLPAVLIQVELLRDRLKAFAEWQAGWFSLGWEIRHIELKCEAKDTQLQYDGGVVGIEGRIDRIDYNTKSKEWAIFDYKTGDKEGKPEQTHKKRGRGWVDLQLPLYRLLARHHGVTNPKLGLIPIGSSGSVSEEIANWKDEDLAEADQLAAQIAARISRAEFWPPSESISGEDEYSVLCGSDQLIEDAEEEAVGLEAE